MVKIKLPSLPWWEWIVACVIVGIGAFLRLYHIDQTVMFLGDQGRDAIIAKRILKDHDIALIGPVTSVGNMYLGPFYYYFMVPWLALTYPSPIGPAYGTALANILSIVLLILVTKKHIGSGAAYIGGGLYALFPVAVQYSRFSWNPNLAPLVSILLFDVLLNWYKRPKFRHAVIIGILMGILIQLHYVALVLFPVIAFTAIALLLRKKLLVKQMLLHSLAVLVFVTLLLSPLAVFDFRHDHMILKTFSNFFTSPEQHIEPVSKFSRVLFGTDGRWYRLISQLVIGGNSPQRDRPIAVSFLLIFVFLIFKQAKLKKCIFPPLLAIVWLLITALGTAFYSSGIYDHYLSFCFPILAVSWGYLGQEFWSFRYLKILPVLSTLMIAGFFYRELIKFQWNGIGLTYFQNTTNEVMHYLKTPYNIVLLSDYRDYKGLNYRYFFEVSNKPPLSEDNYAGLKQLVIINEEKTQNPLSVPIYEIQGTGLTNLVKKLPESKMPEVLIFE